MFPREATSRSALLSRSNHIKGSHFPLVQMNSLEHLPSATFKVQLAVGIASRSSFVPFIFAVYERRRFLRPRDTTSTPPPVGQIAPLLCALACTTILGDNKLASRFRAHANGGASVPTPRSKMSLKAFSASAQWGRAPTGSVPPRCPGGPHHRQVVSVSAARGNKWAPWSSGDAVLAELLFLLQWAQRCRTIARGSVAQSML